MVINENWNTYTNTHKTTIKTNIKNESTNKHKNKHTKWKWKLNVKKSRHENIINENKHITTNQTNNRYKHKDNYRK